MTEKSPQRTYPHYFKKIPEGVSHIDIYAVLRLWEVTDPALQHAVKKLLCSGNRGAKNRETDLREARDSIDRAIEMHAQFEQGEAP